MFAASPAATAAPPRYSVLKIGQVSVNSHPLNDLGQVVGTTGFGAFLTQPNAPYNPSTDLIAGTKEGFGANNLGQVAGNYDVGQGRVNGFRTRPGQPFDPAIDGVGSFGENSTAFAINDLGQTTGEVGQAYRLNMGEKIPGGTLLGTLGGRDSAGRDINEAGQVAGTSLMPGNQLTHAFRTAPNARINPPTDDLGTLGGNESFANAINASGMVAGAAEVLPGQFPVHAYRTAPNAAIDIGSSDLGTLGGLQSTAEGINDAGWVVGSANWTLLDNNSFHAFVFDGTTMWDLNDLIDTTIFFPLAFGRGINNRGQILADSLDFTYLLTPIPVPEPNTAMLIAVAAVAFGLIVAHRGCRTKWHSNKLRKANY